MGKVIGSMRTRLEHLFIRLSSTMPSDPVLAVLSTMIRTAQAIMSNLHQLDNAPRGRAGDYTY